MGRLVSAGSLVYGQADFFFPSGTTNRVSGIVASNLSLIVFSNNAILPWVLADGSGVPDSGISAGTVYFNEITGASGFYSVRFFPDRVSAWRIVLTSVSLSQQVILEYDSLPPGVLRPPSGGLNASFSGGSC